MVQKSKGGECRSSISGKIKGQKKEKKTKKKRTKKEIINILLSVVF
tara:strand:- start:931 stop:1068 length:138 start_codon:yes stop_codon:yes gene_type:complete